MHRDEIRDRKVVALRDQGYTLEEIGEIFGIGREWIRQLDARQRRILALHLQNDPSAEQPDFATAMRIEDTFGPTGIAEDKAAALAAAGVTIPVIEAYLLSDDDVLADYETRRSLRRERRAHLWPPQPVAPKPEPRPITEDERISLAEAGWMDEPAAHPEPEPEIPEAYVEVDVELPPGPNVRVLPNNLPVFRTISIRQSDLDAGKLDGMRWHRVGSPPTRLPAPLSVLRT